MSEGLEVDNYSVEDVMMNVTQVEELVWRSKGHRGTKFSKIVGNICRGARLWKETRNLSPGSARLDLVPFAARQVKALEICVCNSKEL